jgi:hypothetical protein
MDKEILEKLAEQDKKLEAIFISVEKTRKYFLWTAIFNMALFILPLIALLAAIPWLLRTMDYSGLGL